MLTESPAARVSAVLVALLAAGVQIESARQRDMASSSGSGPAGQRQTAEARFGPAAGASQAPAAAALSPTVIPPRQVFDKYCVSCHNERLKTAGLKLDKLDAARVGDRADVWEK